MLILFFTMQLLKCIVLYGIPLPGNARIVVIQVRKTVNFELLSLKHLMVIYATLKGDEYENDDNDETLAERYNNFVSQMDNDIGFKTPQIFKNLDISIVLFGLILVIGLLSGIVYIVLKRSRVYIEK